MFLPGRRTSNKRSSTAAPTVWCIGMCSCLWNWRQHVMVRTSGHCPDRLVVCDCLTQGFPNCDTLGYCSTLIEAQRDAWRPLLPVFLGVPSLDLTRSHRVLGAAILNLVRLCRFQDSGTWLGWEDETAGHSDPINKSGNHGSTTISKQTTITTFCGS